MQAPFADPLSGIELISRPLPLVGREGEMQLLCNLLDTVALQRVYGARALIMSGETGIGKTRLLAEMCQEASKRGFHLLEGRAYEVSRSFPYMPFTEALRPIIRASSLKRLRYLVGLDTIESDRLPGDDDPDTAVSISLVGPPMVAALARLFPELPHILKVAITPEPLTPDQEKFRLFDAIATLLERMAAEYPVMLSIDNLQWADSASLELTMYLTVRLRSCPVALVGVTRPPARPTGDGNGDSIETERQAAATMQILGELMRQGLLLFLPVQPLILEGAQQHLRALLPGTIVGAEALLERAGGNPFFLEELVRMLTVNGRLEQHDGVWDVTRASAAALPTSIALAVMERLGTLSKACLEVVRIAALFGRSFLLPALVVVTGESENWVQARIDEAEQALIIAPSARYTSSEEYEDDFVDDDGISRQVPPATHLFCQSIVQEVLSGQVSAQRASVLHGKIGAALEAYYARLGIQAPAAELARHYVLSGESAAALRWSLQAGEDAVRQQAYREAIGHFRAALELLQADLLAAGEEPRPLLAQVYVMIGESWFKVGELNQAAKSLQKALEQIQRASTTYMSDNLQVSLTARANRMLADVYRMQGKYELTLAHLQAARNALEARVGETGELVVSAEQGHSYGWISRRSFVGQGDQPARHLLDTERILLLQAQGTLDLLLGRAEESERNMWQSYQLATESGDRGSQAFALHFISWIRGWGSHIHEAIRLQSQAHELYVAIGDPFRAALGDQGLGIIYQALGEMEKARLHNVRGFEMARRYGVRHVLGWLHWNMGVMALAEGKWAECESRMQQAMQEAEATSNERLKPIIIQLQAELAFRKGAWQEAEQLFQASISAAMNTEWYPSTPALYGHFLAVTGRKAEAKVQLERAAALQEPIGYSGHYYIPFLAEGFLHIGASEQATTYIERIQQLRGFMYYGIAVDRIRGEVAALNSHWDEAGQAFDDGLKLCRRVGNQPEEAAILYEQARTILMRTGKQDIPTSGAFDTIQRLCQLARDIFLRYDMQRAVNMVDTLLEGLHQLDVHKMPQAPHKIVEQHLAHEEYILDLHLTRRELDVLRLVAEGQTDREVAEALVISPRTVNRHLSNIFVKLDVPGRAAAVAYAIRQGLVG
jgi:DNA-binding CsgD family transcriptional regulator/tetratricopeptide (TPR) repeat protein